MLCIFKDTATTEIYTLSLHDALPILKKKQFIGSGKNLQIHKIFQWNVTYYHSGIQKYGGNPGNLTRLNGFRVHSDRKSTRLNSSHVRISYAVFCLKKKKKKNDIISCM